MSVKTLADTAAFDALDDEAFGLAWDTLHGACPWATAFQNRLFAATWYHVYRERYSPLLIVEHLPDGQLAGLLALAVARDTGDLISAGGRDAEYDVWLALPQADATFPPEAISAVQREVPGADLTFRYIPPGTPLDWLDAEGKAVVPHRLEIWPRPIMDLAQRTGGRDPLRKKSNKSRLNRLKRLGEVRFQRITQSVQLERVLDTIADFSDLRHGALHDALPFRRDPLKKQLL